MYPELDMFHITEFRGFVQMAVRYKLNPGQI